jgi:hypothetical protein
VTRFRITLIDQGGDAPAGRRLAGVLKVALRKFGFRCTQAVELAEGEDADARQEVARLRGIVEGLAGRVAAQSELLARRAEKGGGR